MIVSIAIRRHVEKEARDLANELNRLRKLNALLRVRCERRAWKQPKTIACMEWWACQNDGFHSEPEPAA